MMHVDLSFYEAIGLVIVLIGAAWALLKQAAIQFNKGLDARFEAAEELAKERAIAQDEKLKHIDGLLGKVGELETAALKQQLENQKLFCTKDELKEAKAAHDAISKAIFEALRRIEDKLENKVNRGECEGCSKSRVA